MKSLRRPRLSLLGSMIALAIIAVALSWFIVERRRRLAPLQADLARAKDRAAWSESMYQKKMLSTAQRDVDRNQLEKAQSRASQLWPASE